MDNDSDKTEQLNRYIITDLVVENCKRKNIELRHGSTDNVGDPASEVTEHGKKQQQTYQNVLLSYFKVHKKILVGHFWLNQKIGCGRRRIYFISIKPHTHRKEPPDKIAYFLVIITIPIAIIQLAIIEEVLALDTATANEFALTII